MTEDKGHLEAEWACAKLITTFAHFIDHRRYDDLLSLLTDDCIVEWPGHAVPGHELVTLMKQTPETAVSRHILAAPLFEEVGAETIRTVSYLTLYEGESADGGPAALSAPTALAEYHDSFRLTAKGWRMSRRTVKLVMAPAA